MCNLENLYSYTRLIFEIVYIYLSLSWFQCFAWDSLQVSTGHIPIDIASMIHTSLRKQDPFLPLSFRHLFHPQSYLYMLRSIKIFTFPPFNCGRSLVNTSISCLQGPGYRSTRSHLRRLGEVHRLWLHPEDTKVPSILESSIFRSVASAWSQVWAHGSVGMPRPTGWEFLEKPTGWEG